MSKQLTVRFGVHPQLTILLVFFSLRNDLENLLNRVQGLAKKLHFDVQMPQRTSEAGIPLLFATTARDASISFFDDFVELRSSVGDRQLVKDLLVDQIAQTLINERGLDPTGITLRFIDQIFLRMASRIDVAFKKIGASVSQALGIDGDKFETMSFKFFVEESKGVHELDIGPSLTALDRIYFELESRYGGVTTWEELTASWEGSMNLLEVWERKLAEHLSAEDQG